MLAVKETEIAMQNYVKNISLKARQATATWKQTKAVWTSTQAILK